MVTGGLLGGAVPVESLEECEREHILKAVEEANGVIAGPSGAAARLGMARSTLVYRMRKLAIPGQRRTLHE